MQIPLHITLRRSIKRLLNKILKIFSPKVEEKVVNKENIKKILIIRINYRIGNMLFLTPLLQQLHKEFPNTSIDLLIGASYTKSLFKGYRNINNIYDFPRKLLKNPIQMFQYIHDLRETKYDVVLNLNSSSSSDKLATLLSRSIFKVSFCNERIYTPINICVKKIDNVEHEALKPLELLKAFGVKPNYSLKLNLQLSKNEIEEAKRVLKNLIDKKDVVILGIFRDARFDKKIEDDYWKKLLTALKQKGDFVFIDILSPDITEKLDKEMFEYSQKDLRKLAAFMANLDGFICGDTGPMHLASASGVATIALFKTTAPSMYGTLKENDVSLNILEVSVEEVANTVLKVIK